MYISLVFLGVGLTLYMIYTMMPGTKGAKAAAGTSFNIRLFFNSKNAALFNHTVTMTQIQVHPRSAITVGQGKSLRHADSKENRMIKKRAPVVLFSSSPAKPVNQLSDGQRNFILPQSNTNTNSWPKVQLWQYSFNWGFHTILESREGWNFSEMLYLPLLPFKLVSRALINSTQYFMQISFYLQAHFFHHSST